MEKKISNGSLAHAEIIGLNGGGSLSRSEQIATATEMFYRFGSCIVWDKAKGQSNILIVRNTTKAILSLTNVKVTYKADPNVRKTKMQINLMTAKAAAKYVQDATIKELKPCEHAYTVSVTKKPTAAATGTAVVTCSFCDFTKTFELPALSSEEYSYQLISEATCTTAGLETYTTVLETYGEAVVRIAFPSKGHVFDTASDDARDAQGAVTHTCTVCGMILTDEDADPIVPDSTLPDIKSAQLRLSNDITIAYVAEVPEGYENPFMEFTMNGKSHIVTDYTVDESGRYCFEFTNITPQHMGDNITAVLHASSASGEYTDTVGEYSVKQYCQNMITKNPDDDQLTALLSDLLIYGAAAQKYCGYKADTLVTDGMDLTPGAYEPTSDCSISFSGSKNTSADWKSASLILSNNLAVRFAFTAESIDGLQVCVNINGREQVYDAEEMQMMPGTENVWYVDYYGILATEFGDTVLASFCRNGEQLGRTVNYSVNAYIKKRRSLSMNKPSFKIMAIILCAVLCLSSVVTVFALTNDKTEDQKKDAVTATTTANTDKDSTKDETVYVLAGADGSVQKIIVGDWIKNALGAASITDSTGLSDIENVNGNESYTISGNAKVWDAHGNDIYYRGNIEKELPVGMTVTYTLDGKKVSADEIAGKTGKVSIRFDYDNRQYEMVKIDGKEEKIYVPFAMLTGMLLDNEHFRNVEVTNGKIINDGDRTAVVGIALPGLQENLGISKDKLNIPDYVEITADASDFSFGMTVTIATNELFNNLNTSKLDSVDDLTGSIGELSNGMKQLLDGSSALYGGLTTLLDKSKELVSGINQLADGAKVLKDGAVSVDDGAGQLKAGAAELASGLNTLKGNNDTLNGGAKQVFETLLSTAETQIKAGGISVPALTIDNYAQVLTGVINSLDETSVYNQALAQVTAAVEGNRPLIIEKVTAAVREQVETQVIAAVQEQVSAGIVSVVRGQVADQIISAATGMNKSDYEAAVSAGMIPAETQNSISAAIETQMQTNEVKALIESNTTEKMESDEIKTTVASNTNAQMQTESIQKTISDNVELQIKQEISENMASDEVTVKLAAASEGAKSIISLKTSLDSYNSFYLGLLTYTNGVASAADGASVLASGASDLKDGTAQLKAGAATLYDGILQLKNGAPALVEGVSQLKDGAMQLSDGLKKFNEEGVQKIIELVDGDMKGIVTRLKATIDVSKNYRNFSGISDDMGGQVKFIYRTEEIKSK